MKLRHLRWMAMFSLLLLSLLSLAAVVGAQDEDDPNGRPFLGIRVEQTADGVVVEEVLPNSPAADADLQVGDVLTAINGEDIRSAREVVRTLRGFSPGDGVVLDVQRGDETLSVEVTLGSLRDAEPGMVMPMLPGMGGMMMPMNGRLGVAFDVLTEEIASELDIDVAEGAVIREVVADSPAAEAGLQVQDVITAVNDEPVDAERTLRDRLFAYEPGDSVTLTVLRGGETLDVEVTLAEPPMHNWMDMLPGLRHGEGMGVPAPALPGGSDL